MTKIEVNYNVYDSIQFDKNKYIYCYLENESFVASSITLKCLILIKLCMSIQSVAILFSNIQLNKKGLLIFN